MKVVVWNWLPSTWCGAFTFYPWVVVSKVVNEDRALFHSIVELHEAVHYARQKEAREKHGRWGLAKWHLRYLLCWPIWKNDFRREEETLAFRAQGFQDDEIRRMLAARPYYLRS